MIKNLLKENAIEDLYLEIEQMKRTYRRLNKVRKFLSKDTPIATSTNDSELRDVQEKMFDLERNIRDAERFIMLSKCLFENA